MAQFYDSHTYIAASMRLDSVCAWLEGLGVLKAENQESLGEKIFAYNQAFIKTYRSLWQLQVDARTFGTVAVLDVPCCVGITEKLITCHEVVMNNSVPINTKNYALLRELADRVFKGKPNRSL